MIGSVRARANRAIVIIPGSVNYFYNQTGRRIAEALRELGLVADVRTLQECPSGAVTYDLCLLCNMSEIQHGYGDEEKMLEHLDQIRNRATITLSLALECVTTSWYRKHCDLGRKCHADVTLDLGLISQEDNIPPDLRNGYHFAFNGLTHSEKSLLQRGFADKDRPLPWATIGHKTPDRVALVDYLIQHVHPGGFAYLPALAPITENNSPHLNQQQFERVLKRTRFQVWRSHHSHFYLESERFRMSALTGSVPVKVVDPDTTLPLDIPFGYLVMAPHTMTSRLSDLDTFRKLREIHQREWLARPSLASSLANVLNEFGMKLTTSLSQAA